MSSPTSPKSRCSRTIAKLAQRELATVDRVLEVAQPRLDRPLRSAELRIGADRDQGRRSRVRRNARPPSRRRPSAGASAGRARWRSGSPARGRGRRRSRPARESRNPSRRAARRRAPARRRDERPDARTRDALAAVAHGIDGDRPRTVPFQHGTHRVHVAGALVTEAKRRADHDRANAEASHENLENVLRRQRRDAIVELDEEALLEAGGREKVEPLCGRADQRRLGARPQMRRRMIGKRQHAGAPAGFAHAAACGGRSRDVRDGNRRRIRSPGRAADRRRARARDARASYEDFARREQRAERFADADERARLVAHEDVPRPVAPSGSGTTRPARKSADSRRSARSSETE